LLYQFAQSNGVYAAFEFIWSDEDFHDWGCGLRGLKVEGFKGLGVELAKQRLGVV
jgi:hypothetical protein